MITGSYHQIMPASEAEARWEISKLRYKIKRAQKFLRKGKERGSYHDPVEFVLAIDKALEELQ